MWGRTDSNLQFFLSIARKFQISSHRIAHKKMKCIVFQRRKMRSSLSFRQTFLKARGFELNPRKNVSGWSYPADR
jgi:hypothetical protein